MPNGHLRDLPEVVDFDDVRREALGNGDNFWAEKMGFELVKLCKKKKKIADQSYFFYLFSDFLLGRGELLDSFLTQNSRF